jgi:hypothetical protein
MFGQSVLCISLHHTRCRSKDIQVVARPFRPVTRTLLADVPLLDTMKSHQLAAFGVSIHFHVRHGHLDTVNGVALKLDAGGRSTGAVSCASHCIQSVKANGSLSSGW